MTIYKKKGKGGKKPGVYVVGLILSLIMAPALAGPPEKGDLAIGAGYATMGTLGDYKTVRDSGYSGSIEYWTDPELSLLFEGQKMKAGNVYEASITPKLGSLFLPIGVSYFDVDGEDPEYGAHVGLGINFWAERFLGLQVQAQYHYLLDQIAGEDQFLAASGTLRFKF